MKRQWDPNRFHPAWKAFQYQRSNAEGPTRNIPWELTFKQWWNIWKRSGHWDERGRNKNNYCMARIGDAGPYSVDNVLIITNSENRYMRKPHSHTEEFKKALSLRSRGNKYGIGNKNALGLRHTKKSKERMRDATKKLWQNPAYRKKMENRGNQWTR
jgi:hypothetical protein